VPRKLYVLLDKGWSLPEAKKLFDTVFGFKNIAAKSAKMTAGRDAIIRLDVFCGDQTS